MVAEEILEEVDFFLCEYRIIPLNVYFFAGGVLEF